MHWLHREKEDEEEREMWSGEFNLLWHLAVVLDGAVQEMLDLRKHGRIPCLPAKEV